MGLLRRRCGHCTGDWDVGGDYMVAVWGVVGGGAEVGCGWNVSHT